MEPGITAAHGLGDRVALAGGKHRFERFAATAAKTGIQIIIDCAVGKMSAEPEIDGT
ncbi:MAG: hypothetical protein U0893_04000 [Chloroflexota bacterium]